jgi:hypothetical protein
MGEDDLFGLNQLQSSDTFIDTFEHGIWLLVKHHTARNFKRSSHFLVLYLHVESRQVRCFSLHCNPEALFYTAHTDTTIAYNMFYASMLIVFSTEAVD